MNMRTTLCTALLGATLILTGCNGPGPHGKKMRTEAQARLDSMNAQITYKQAMQSFEVGRFDRALRNINAAIERYPEVPEYYVLQGRIFIETGRLESAIRSFEEAIALDEEFADAHYYAGIVYQRWADDEQAHTHYSRAFELEDTNPQYLLAAAESKIALGELDSAWNLLEENESYFENSAALHQLKGQIALMQGDPDLAVELYKRARLLNPEDSLLLEELAWAQFDARQYGDCQTTLHKLKQQFGEDRSELRHLEAQCFAAMGRTSEARNIYIELTRDEPNNADLWTELGLIAWDLGDYYRVDQCADKLMSLAPQRYEGFLFRAVKQRHDGNIDAAIEQLETAVELSMTNALPSLLLGNVYESSGQFERAHEAYQQALRVEPDNSEARILIARLEHDQRGQSVNAETTQGLQP